MPKVEIITKSGERYIVEFAQMPSADDIDEAVRQIETTPAPAQKSRGLLGGLNALVQRGVQWFMNTPVGKWLSASPTPVAPGGPVARQIAAPTPPPAPAPTDPIVEANRLVAQGMSRKEAAKQVAATMQPAPEPLATLQHFWGALIDPASLSNTPHQKPPLFYQLFNLLNAPIYALSASSIERIPEQKRPARFKGRDWASLYGEQPTAGTWLEAQYPNVPAWLRSLGGFGLDYLASMLYTGGLGKTMQPFKEVASKTAMSIPAVREAIAALKLKALSALHPTAAREIREYPFKLKQPTVTTSLVSDLPELAGRLFKQAEEFKSSYADQLEALLKGLKEADRLSPSYDSDSAFTFVDWWTARWISPKVNPEATREAILHWLDWLYMESADELARELEDALGGRNWGERMAKIREVQSRLRDVGNAGTGSGAVGALVRGLDEATMANPPQPDELVAVAETLRRLRQTEPTLWEKLMSHWKRAMTVLNFPAGAVRNFVGNFIAQYLAGAPLDLRSLLFGKPVRELINEAFATTRLTRKPDIGQFSHWGERLARFYSGADKLAAGLLARITGKPPKEFLIGEDFYLPETIDTLQRWGLVPFATWPTWIAPRLWHGLKTTPWRYAALGRAITSKDTENQYRVDPATLIARTGEGKGVSVEPLLPISPYLFASDRGEAPDILVRWFLPALWRDTVQALQGEGATPRAPTWSPPKEAYQDPKNAEWITRQGPYIDALATLLYRLTPSALWNIARLTTPNLFADAPNYQLKPEDFVLRLLGAPIRSISPIPSEAIERKDDLRQLRMRARAANYRERKRQ
ncbi:MAG: hypothetical protein KatS3mg023_4000 [Armatimonadota bacterium]|nr:MAG: hypothetical protein KatS3mg023_4000 [Armatimonadota bacterium]